MIKRRAYFPAEWEQQSGVQLTWPGPETDWFPMLDEVLVVYEQLAVEILRREKLLVVCQSKKQLPLFLQEERPDLIVREMPVNDTWARDHGAITVMDNGNLQPAMIIR